MRIRKRNRILKRVVLGFAVLALLVPAGRVKASVDEGLGAPAAKAEQSGVQLADPKYGQSAEGAYVPFVTDFPKSVQTTDVRSPIALRDIPKSLPSVELGTYGMPAAGRNVYLETHSGKALVNRDDVSTPTAQVVSSGGFDWSDAGIGAGILAGFVLISGMAFVAARRVGRPQTA